MKALPLFHPYAPCPCQCESGLQKSSDYLIELFNETSNVRKINLKIKMD